MADVSILDIAGSQWNFKDNGARSEIYATNYKFNIAQSYSTAESETGGTWIDGKKIFRKVVSLPQGSSVDISSWNVDTPIKVFGSAVYSNTRQAFPHFGTSREIYSWAFSKSSLRAVSVGWSSSWTNAYIVCEYTKSV